MKTTKEGKNYRESIIDPTKGFEEFVRKNYLGKFDTKFNMFNASQAFIVNTAIELIEKNEPFWMNVQGEGGSGKSFIINYIAAKYPKRNIRTA